MAQAYVYEDDAAGWRHIQSGDVPSGSGSPLTTKGDLYGFSTVNARVPVGANNTVLTADSTQALGVKWATGGSGITDLTSTGSTITVTTPTGPTTNVDLPASGVTAGTYGDATHVAEVTVDAEGRVTTASSVAISGSSGAGGLVTLYDSGYLGADAASIDTGAGGIAAGHGVLHIYIYARAADAVAGQNLIGTFNNDTGANYQQVRTREVNNGLGGISVAGQTAFLAAIVPGNTATANVFGSASWTVPAYDQTTNFKAGTGTSTNPNNVAASLFLDVYGLGWYSTAAISRLKIASQGGGNLKAGSRLLICGTQ